MQVRGFASCTIDNADADGLITAGGHGYGYTWRFHGKDEDSYDRSVEMSPTWNHRVATPSSGWADPTAPEYYDQTCYIPALRACAPRGAAPMKDMMLADWTQDHGTWIPASMTWNWSKRFLCTQAVEGDGNYQVSSIPKFRPNIAMWCHRAMPTQDQTETARTYLGLMPESGEYWWAYYLPISSRDGSNDRPLLLRPPRGVWPTFGHAVDEWQGYSGYPGVTSNGLAVPEFFSVELTDGALILTSGFDDPWVYAPKEGVTIPLSTVRVAALGHGMSFNLQQIKYPTVSVAEPFEALTTPDWIHSTHTYYPYAPRIPTGCNVSVTSAVTSSTTSPATTDKPRITFTTNRFTRPVLYHVAQLHDAVIADARSAPVGPEATLMSARWSVDDTWRGATADLTFRVDRNQHVYTGNNKVTLDAGWHVVDGTTYTRDSTRQFTGYAVRQTRGKTEDDLGKVQLTLHCEDGIAARLAGKKPMWGHAAYGGLSAYRIAAHLLNRAGVPDSLVDMSDLGVSVLPGGVRGGDLTCEWNADMDVVAAEDKIAELHGGYFGVAPDGTYRIVRRAAYTGTPDWTMDEESVTDADLIQRVEVERGHDQFRNYILAMCGQGANSYAALAADTGTHRTVTNPDFLGDDWWEVLTQTEASSQAEAQILAVRRLQETIKRRQVIHWTTPGKADLFPEDYVLVNTTGLDVPVGTVFRIVSKEGSIDVGSGDFRTSFVGIIDTVA